MNDEVVAVHDRNGRVLIFTKQGKIYAIDSDYAHTKPWVHKLEIEVPLENNRDS
jgi:hypothetical protein